MKFAEYAQVPGDVQDAVIKAYLKKKKKNRDMSETCLY